MFDTYLQDFIKKNKISVEEDNQILLTIPFNERWEYVKDFFNNMYGDEFDVMIDEKSHKIKVFFEDTQTAGKFENTCENGLLKYIRTKLAECGKNPKEYNFNFTSTINHTPGTKVVDYTVV